MPDTQFVTIEGERTEARIMGLAEDDLEDRLVEQVRAMVDSEAFEGTVRIMPDTHPGSGAVIGFTMDLDHDGPLRVCPNTVGVDLGCGLLAARLTAGGQPDASATPSPDTLDMVAADARIREAVPMGRSVHDDPNYHMGEDFPWELCTDTWEMTTDAFGLDNPEWFEGYGLDEYFKPLCERVDYDPMRAINSMGTLGGGNHFIELDVDEAGDHWVVLHSGSRGIGLTIAQYWQDNATQSRTNDWIRDQCPDELEDYIVPDMDDPELAQWFQGGMGQSYIDSEAIKADVNNNPLIGFLHDCLREAHPQNRDVNTDLDYLEAQEAAGYLVDMIFAQTYAWANRNRMLELILQALDVGYDEAVHSPHNMIDFEDRVLRKGATRAHEGELFVLPFNMADGTYICAGTGNEEWNRTAPHGAGRTMSRTQAHDVVDMDEFEAKMDGIHSTSVTEATKDEAPSAYKPAELIADAIEPTADVVHDLDPILSIKAQE